MKYLKIAGIICLFAFLYVSCSDDGEDDESFISDFDYPAETLYGTWEIKKWGVVNWSYLTSKTTTATFYSDGTYYGKGYFGTGTGTYEATGSYIYCYIDNELFCNYEVLSLSADTAVLNMTIGETTFKKLTCIKQ